MSTKQALTELMDRLPEERQAEVLDFARFVAGLESGEDWRRFGREQLARAYGGDEPEYTHADLKPETR